MNILAYVEPQKQRENDDGFAVVPNLIYGNKKFSSTAKVVYYALCSFANQDTGLCCPKLKAIADRCGLKPSTVGKYIGELENEGAVKVRHEFYKSQGMWKRKSYYTLFTLDPDTGKEVEPRFLKKGYTVVQTAVLRARSTRARSSVKNCYIAMLSFRNQTTGECLMSQSEIAERVGCSVDTVQRAEKLLRRAGKIVTETQDGMKSSYTFPSEPLMQGPREKIETPEQQELEQPKIVQRPRETYYGDISPSIRSLIKSAGIPVGRATADYYAEEEDIEYA